MTARVTVLVSGRVQGVGFRDWVRRLAGGLGLSGVASNLPDGRVEVVAEGDQCDLDTLLAALRGGRTPGAVGAVEESWTDAQGDVTGFGVR